MKKSLIVLAAGAAMLASCSSDEIKVDKQYTSKDDVIGFSTYAGKATRGTENSGAGYSWELKDHHNNFAVWGYKNTEAAKVFDNQLVSWGTAWTYTPVRFWDKAASTYEFYAAAPQTDENGATVAWVLDANTDAQDDDYFTLAGVTLVGSNLSATNPTVTTDYVNSFIAAPKVGTNQDIDYMIADKKSVANAAFGQTVELQFIHILSRLNVTVKKGAEMGDAVVKLVILNVKNLIDGGSFDESKVSGTTLHAGTVGRWDLVETTTPLTAIGDVTLTTTAQYVLQSLIVPQTVAFEEIALDGTGVGTTSKPYFEIVYTINTGAGDEQFTAYYNLADVFGVTDGNTLAFNEGWQNTLNITINPAADPTNVISFSANVAEWADPTTAGEVIVK